MSQYTTNEFRKGLRIEYEGNLYKIVEVNFVKPGKGTAFYKTKMKGLLGGGTVERNFRTGEKVGAPEIEDRTMMYQYQDGENAWFMDDKTYEQFPVHLDIIGDDVNWLYEDDENPLKVDVIVYQGRPIDMSLPNFVELKITECAPGVKGDTATNTTKAATVSTGAEVQVPLFVNEGDWIKVDTRTGGYDSRVNK